MKPDHVHNSDATYRGPRADCPLCRMDYPVLRKEIEDRAPEGWDMSSSIAFRCFLNEKANDLQRLDDIFKPPSRWELFKRRWGLRW